MVPNKTSEKNMGLLPNITSIRSLSLCYTCTVNIFLPVWVTPTSLFHILIFYSITPEYIFNCNCFRTVVTGRAETAILVCATAL
jgi:hypothetical protein